MAENTLLRLLKKLKPYTVKKGLRYLKHYGLKGFSGPSGGADGTGGGSLRSLV